MVNQIKNFEQCKHGLYFLQHFSFYDKNARSDIINIADPLTFIAYPQFKQLNKIKHSFGFPVACFIEWVNFIIKTYPQEIIPYEFYFLLDVRCTLDIKKVINEYKNLKYIKDYKKGELYAIEAIEYFVSSKYEQNKFLENSYPKTTEKKLIQFLNKNPHIFYRFKFLMDFLDLSEIENLLEEKNRISC